MYIYTHVYIYNVYIYAYIHIIWNDHVCVWKQLVFMRGEKSLDWFSFVSKRKQAGSHGSIHQSVANKATDVWRGYAVWSTARTCTRCLYCWFLFLFIIHLNKPRNALLPCQDVFLGPRRWQPQHHNLNIKLSYSVRRAWLWFQVSTGGKSAWHPLRGSWGIGCLNLTRVPRMAQWTVWILVEEQRLYMFIMGMLFPKVIFATS